MNLSEWMSRERPLVERLRALETISFGLTQPSARNGKGAFLDPSRIQVAADGTCRLREGMSSAAEAGYRAPEFIGRGNPSVRADVFVAGVIAYQLLTGEHPFGGEDPAEERPRPLGDLQPGLPAGLSEAVMACLEVDPEGRAKDVAHLHEVVREVRERGALESTQIGGLSPAARLDMSATVLSGGPLHDTSATVRAEAPPVDMVSTLVPGTSEAQGVAAAAAAHAPGVDTAATIVPGGAEAAAVAEAASPGITTAPTLEILPSSPPAPAAAPREERAVAPPGEPALAVEAWPSAVTEAKEGAAVAAAATSPAPAASAASAATPSPPPSASIPAAQVRAIPSAPRAAAPLPTAPAAPAKSGGGMGAIAAAAGLAVVGIAGFLWWRSSSSSSPGSTLAASASSTPTLVAGATPPPEALLAATETTTVVRSGEPPKAPPGTGPAAPATPPPAAAATPRPDARSTTSAAAPPPTVAAAPPSTETPRVEAPLVTAPPVTAPPAPVVVTPSAAAEPASISNVSPPLVRRPSNALVDVHGAGFRPDHQARILRGGRPASGVTVVRQRYVSATLLQVLLKLDSEASPGAYQLVVADGQGVVSNVRAFEVGK